MPKPEMRLESAVVNPPPFRRTGYTNGHNGHRPHPARPAQGPLFTLNTGVSTPTPSTAGRLRGSTALTQASQCLDLAHLLTRVHRLKQYLCTLMRRRANGPDDAVVLKAIHVARLVSNLTEVGDRIIGLQDEIAAASEG